MLALLVIVSVVAALALEAGLQIRSEILEAKRGVTRVTARRARAA